MTEDISYLRRVVKISNNYNLDQMQVLDILEERVEKYIIRANNKGKSYNFFRCNELFDMALDVMERYYERKSK